MYVRWVIRQHKNADIADVTFHDAYLVESYRDEANTPRQRTICYLGNIRQIGGEFPMIERELFFLRADRILGSQPGLSANDREQVLVLLRQKVPEMTPAEVTEAFRNNLRWYHQWWRERGTTLSREEFVRFIEEAGEGLGPM